MTDLILRKLEVDMNEKHYRPSDLADEFGKSRQTIHNWIKNGRFPNHETIGEGDSLIILVPASDVERVREEEAAKLKDKLSRLGFLWVPA